MNVKGKVWCQSKKHNYQHFHSLTSVVICSIDMNGLPYRGRLDLASKGHLHLHDSWWQHMLTMFLEKDPVLGAHVAASSHDRMTPLVVLYTWRGVGPWNSNTRVQTHTHTGKLRGTHCENISFLYVMGVLCSLCDRFQSERESGDRNFAIGYYLKEKKVWPWMSHEALLTLFLCLLMFCCPTKLKGNNCEQDEVCVCKRRSWLLRHQCFCRHQ